MLFPRELARSWRSLRVIGFLVIGIRRNASRPRPRNTPDRPPARPATPRPTSAGEDPHGERRARSQGASRRDHSRSQQGRSAIVTFTKDAIAFVYGSKWKQRYFTKVGDDYFPSARAVGRRQSDAGAAIMVANGTDWWVPLLSRRQHAAAHRPAVRRLPLGQLQHPDQDRSPNGTWAAKNATARAACMSRGRRARTS